MNIAANSDALVFFWFRRDLRLEDNHGLYQALSQKRKVQPIFIFDQNILEKLHKDDGRISYIYLHIIKLKKELSSLGSDLWVYFGKPEKIWQEILKQHKVAAVFANHDYEPYASARDKKIETILSKNKIPFLTFKDQVIFEKTEVLSGTKTPYTVYTPYKNKWLSLLQPQSYAAYPTSKMYQFFHRGLVTKLIDLSDLGFNLNKESTALGFNIDQKTLKCYAAQRDFPIKDSTSHIGIHLRFGTVSIRTMVALALKHDASTWLSELIWREFFMQVLWNFPYVEHKSFRLQYEKVAWRKNPREFKKWCNGQTGYPIVDAGMRQLNKTGYMHNRVRMIVASFLTKHLLMHWSLGERYFAGLLLDYEMASNNGNWQWAASTGCDAVPYFRIFNPESQSKKFDPDFAYIKKWVPEFQTAKYVKPMVDHTLARVRAVAAYSAAIK